MHRPWMEVGGTIIRIPDNDQGRINAGHLRDKLGTELLSYLEKRKSYIIVSFSNSQLNQT